MAGSFEACADLANLGTAATLTELRCALFLEARRDRHSGGLSTVEPAVRRLLRAIREKVANQELSNRWCRPCQAYFGKPSQADPFPSPSR